MSNSPQGKIALVTGASRGIGAEIALAIGQLGATVIGTATSEQGAQSITQKFQEAQIQGQGLVLNVADEEQCSALVKEIEQKFGTLGILVNNAGITKDNIAMRMKEEEWTDVIQTNLTATYRMIRLVLRGMMKARYGRIINLTSVVASVGNPGQANYAAAKAGIAGMTRSLAQELGSRNITVNCVAPGFIDTDMTKALPDTVKEELVKRIALGRLGKPEEIAASVAFLATEAASYITGTTLHVNGGMYMN